MSKRDGSDYIFLTCPVGTDRQVVKLFCNSNSLDSNCYDIHEGGLAGTILKLPEDCGPGTYAVAHNLSVSGDIYIRVDYSNLPGYWNAVVDSAGEKKKRSADSPIDRRFFSPKASSWKTKFDTVRANTANSLSYTVFSNKFNSPLYSSSKTCSGQSDAYAAIGLTGTVSVKIRFGYSFVGTIVPFNIAQAYGFSESDIAMRAAVKVEVQGGLSPSDTKANVFPTPITHKEFSVPGLIHFKPSLQIVATLKANMGMAGDFEMVVDTTTSSPDGSAGILQYYPSAMGTSSGGSTMKATISGTGIKHSTKGTARFGFMPTMSMDITINSYTGGTVVAHEKISAFHDAYIAISSDGQCPEIQAGISKAQISLETLSGTFKPWSTDGGAQVLLPGSTSSSILSPLCSRISKAKREIPSTVTKYPAPYVFGNYYIINCVNGLSDGSDSGSVFPGDVRFCSNAPPVVPLLDIFDDDGTRVEAFDPADYAESGTGIAKRELEEVLFKAIEKRAGKARTFYMRIPIAAETFVKEGFKTVSYPSKKALVKAVPDIAVWTRDIAKAPTQCATSFITNKGIDSSSIIVEHLFEQGVLIKSLRAMAGITRNLPSGLTSDLTTIPYDVWIRFRDVPLRSPVTGVVGTGLANAFACIGSYALPGGLTLMDEKLNGLKALFHAPSVKSFINADIWAVLSISQKMDVIMNMMSLYKYMNGNSILYQVIVKNIERELLNFIATSPGSENMVAWFKTFVPDHNFDSDSDEKHLG
ncbi:hypothetical protein EAF04_004216 [Stromatinia cepivora]|nr:hypothetical protein EAF04_004216 [Stromatinia cepivora]